MDSIQIVLAAANPRGTTQLQLDDEVRRIEAQLAHSAYVQNLAGQAGEIIPIRLRAVWATQLSDLVRNITAFQPSVIHFSGHGEGPKGLVMSTEGGRSMLVPNSILREVLTEFAATTRLVVLNACHSAVQAEEIRQVIDCVIGMQDGISDQGASLFAAALYGNLAQGCSLGKAFRLARTIMAAQVPGDRDVPCLLSRDGIRPDTVCLSAPPAAPSAGQGWRTMLEPAEPSLSALRQAINQVLPRDADLEAFVQDHRSDPRYARVHREWGSDMQRQRKLTLLFDYGPCARELKEDLLAFVG